MNVLDGAHVQTPGRLDRDQQLRVLVDFPGDDGLLLVAAGHTAGRGDGALTGADVILFDQPVGVVSDILSAQEAGLVGKLRLKIPLEYQVVLQRVVQHQAMLVPVLRNMAHTQKRTLPDGSLCNILSAELHGAAHHRLQAGNAVHQLRLAVAVDAGNADDLAGANLEGHVPNGVVLMHLGSHGQAPDIQNHIAGLGLLLLHHKLHIPAHHHAGELCLVRVGNVHRADVLALAQNGAAVRHGHDFVELMGDKQNGFSLGGQIAHNL